MARISFSSATVQYPVYSTSRQRSILGLAANRASFGHVAREAGRIPIVTALDDISLELNDGDRLALVGRNGSGKTTFLKVCAGLLWPSAGRFSWEGSRSALLNPGAAFDLDKTGVENIEMVAALLGVSRAAKRLLVDDVADFTELGDFLYLPTRTYSAGMMIRLTFALATSIERDILIVDEVIGAGDTHFLEKAAARVRSMFSRAKILILATHSGSIAAQMCNRAVWMHGGKIIASGAPNVVCEKYEQLGHSTESVRSVQVGAA